MALSGANFPSNFRFRHSGITPYSPTQPLEFPAWPRVGHFGFVVAFAQVDDRLGTADVPPA